MHQSTLNKVNKQPHSRHPEPAQLHVPSWVSSGPGTKYPKYSYHCGAILAGYSAGGLHVGDVSRGAPAPRSKMGGGGNVVPGLFFSLVER